MKATNTICATNTTISKEYSIAVLNVVGAVLNISSVITKKPTFATVSLAATLVKADLKLSTHFSNH
jgi:hypothetical protein